MFTFWWPFYNSKLEGCWKEDFWEKLTSKLSKKLMWLQNIKSYGKHNSKVFKNWKLFQISYRHIPHFLQWYGFLSMLVKCLQIVQKYADIFALQLRHLTLSSPIWKKMIWKIIRLTDQVNGNYNHKVLNMDCLIYQTDK